MGMKKYVFLLFFASLNFWAQNPFGNQLALAAMQIIDPTIAYVPSYVSIPYPNGDVDPKTGVCTDVIIRAYRKLGVDLQKEIHEDMKANFGLYPNKKRWGLKTTDKNIDHRRVPNQEKFFERKGQKLAVTKNGADYIPGDIVVWLVGNKLDHIGIVSNQKSTDGKRFLVVHNIGGGQVLEDCLFNYKVTGHYRYYPK